MMLLAGHAPRSRQRAPIVHRDVKPAKAPPPDPTIYVPSPRHRGCIAEDLSHKRFGFLRVLRRAANTSVCRSRPAGYVAWLCACSCGAPDCRSEVVVRAACLTRAEGTVSCGAGWAREAKRQATERAKAHREAVRALVPRAREALRVV